VRGFILVRLRSLLGDRIEDLGFVSLDDNLGGGTRSPFVQKEQKGVLVEGKGSLSRFLASLP